jgi:putative ABC transport system permease protein
MSTSVLPTLLRRFTLRHWRQAPGQSALLVLILALGVAVFVSVRLANRAAVSSFTHFTDVLTGESDWLIRAPAGDLPASVLGELRAALGPRPVHIVPVLETTAALPATTQESGRFGRTSYTLLGLDLVGVANLSRQQEAGRGFFGREAAARNPPPEEDGDNAFWSTFGAGPQVWVSPNFAGGVPETIALLLDERVLSIPVAGTIPQTTSAPRSPANLLVMDLPRLQEISGRTERLSRVEFLVEEGPRLAERREELRVLLADLGGDRWTVSSPGARRESAEIMTRAFRLNLTVLSLIALLVGLYLIFQALDGAVVRRRQEIAILRSLGVRQRVVQQLWLLESVLLGLIGGALGVLLGWAGAQLSVRMVGQTVNALYYNTTVAAAGLSPGEAWVGMGIGLAASVVAGWWPARLAAATPPAQVLQRSSGPSLAAPPRRRMMLALVCVALGILASRLPAFPLAGGGGFPVAGYAAAFLWIFGGGLACGGLLGPVARLASGWGRRSAVARIALSHLRRPSGRHVLAVAALHCAIGMTAGMAILVASFDRTVRTWVQRTLQADLYVSSDGAQSAGADNRLSAAAAEAIATHPDVEAAGRIVAHGVELDGRPTQLNGVDLALIHARSDFPWVSAPRDDAIFDPRRNTGLALVSESFSERFRVDQGDVVQVPTPSGARELTIAGIYADYGNERGAIMVERSRLQEWFQDDRVTSLSLWLKPGVDAEAFRSGLLNDYPGLSALTNARLRSEILRIFRQTFAITYALEIIGVVVAVIGLALTLTSVLLDRRNELTTLRALGFRRRELARSAAIEGAALAASAAAGGLVLSLALGWLLIHVINKQSFGWTLGFAIPWVQLAALGAVVVATGAAVSHAVGRWGAQLSADQEE